MTTVTLTAKSGASSRTRNRLREHPGAFTLKRTDRPLCFNGAVAHLVEHPDGWSGWLPADEVEISTAGGPDTTL